MTKIKKTLENTTDIITYLITELDIANLGNWNTKKGEINALLTYLKNKTSPKPTGANDIEIDLTEIEALETNLTNLTNENKRLTTENAALTTKTTEQDGIIKNTSIPELIVKLEQYAGKVSDGELKNSLTEITTHLTNLKKEQEETKTQIGNIKKPDNYWSIGAVVGIVCLTMLKLIEIFNKNKKNESD